MGHALGEPAQDGGTGVWRRLHSSGLALVNPTASLQTATLPAPPSGSGWWDLYGAKQAGATVDLLAASGLVLVSR